MPTSGEQTSLRTGRRWRGSTRRRGRTGVVEGYTDLAFEVASISDHVGIRALLHLGQDDPRFGRGNSNLSGAATKRDESGRVLLEAEATVEFGESEPESPSPGSATGTSSLAGPLAASRSPRRPRQSVEIRYYFVRENRCLLKSRSGSSSSKEISNLYLVPATRPLTGLCSLLHEPPYVEVERNRYQLT